MRCVLAVIVAAAPIVFAAQGGQRNSWERQYRQRSAESFVAEFEEPSRPIFRYRAAIAGLMQLKPGMTAAEIGAGSGFLARELVARVGPTGHVIATELDEGMIGYMRARAAKEGLANFTVVKGQPAAVGLDPQTVDAIALVATYSYFDHPKEMLQSIAQTLKPGGLLLIVDLPRSGTGSEQSGVDAEDVIAAARGAGLTLVDESAVVPGHYAIRFRRTAQPQDPPRSQSPTLDTSRWNDPEPPFRLAGPIHYVGTAELAAFLIVSSAGHILIDGGLPTSASLIEKSIRTLGFKPEDIQILLTTQAHFDHVGTLAHFKRISGGRVEAMQGDDQLLRDGGASDYLFGKDASYRFPPVTVDRVLRDGDVVSLGDLRLTARLTPGHTPGSATYVTRVKDGAREYAVVFAASVTVNPGTRLVTDPSYPGILSDYRTTFMVLQSLQPDIFLSAHAGFFRLKEKRARMSATNPGFAFVDPEGYRKLIGDRKRVFEALVAKEKKD
jgi:metallo-beta-lactamase class B